MTTCPYGNSAQSLLLGHVYCSRQNTPMQELDTGTLFIKTRKLEETADHESRLSIRLMLNGQQYYRLGIHDHLVTPDNYLLVNQGQHYRTAFSGDTEQEMILVAFRPGFAESLLHSFVKSQDKLLDDPFFEPLQPVQFFEKTYDADPPVSHLFARLHCLINKDLATRKEADLDDIYTALLVRMLEIHRNLKGEVNKIGGVKAATRAELFRRLSIAKDFMDAHLDRRIHLEEVARVACLSPHHFKRAFKTLYGQPPHQYHVGRRLEFCRQQLDRHPESGAEIGRRAGFEDASSFIRLFRERYACTPAVYAMLKK
ncbi:MAG: AraC family transcriptional regulator [Saprospiraceae bacterium]|nr:AraC family transcriptional regulator [Saprospiraceae bacterium]